MRMAFPPIVTATVQSAILAATSNLLAQSLTAYQDETSLFIDWVPVFQFSIYSLLNVPPNFLWQDFLESTFPAYHAPPTPATVASAAVNGEKALKQEAVEGKLVAPKLDITNTAIKMILDQTVGAAVNTFLFSLFMHSIQSAMVRPNDGTQYLFSRGAIDYGKVDWADVIAHSFAEFYPILVASWKVWPIVSLINFAFIKSIQGRNLVGSLAGVGWGVYMSLITSR